SNQAAIVWTRSKGPDPDSVRQLHPRLLRMPAVEQGGMTDAAHDRAVGTRGEIRERFVTLVPFEAGNTNLDELVRRERRAGFGHDRVADAGLPDEDHGFQLVAQATEMTALFLGELHRAIVPGSASLPHGRFGAPALSTPVRTKRRGDPASRPIREYRRTTSQRAYFPNSNGNSSASFASISARLSTSMPSGTYGWTSGCGPSTSKISSMLAKYASIASAPWLRRSFAVFTVSP